MMGINLESMREKRKGAKGFTLIELMIVVAIIGILASILALNYAHAKSNATVSATEANLKEIATALELYYADNQSYPGAGAVNATLIGPNYLPTTPNSPGPSALGAPQPYQFAVDAVNNTYTVQDPANYDSNSLASLPQAGGAPAGGDVVAPVAKCGAGGPNTSVCKNVGYSNAAGIFAW